MNRKDKKRLDIIRKKLQTLKQQLSGIKQQNDEPGEMERIQLQIDQFEEEAATLTTGQ